MSVPLVQIQILGLVNRFSSAGGRSQMAARPHHDYQTPTSRRAAAIDYANVSQVERSSHQRQNARGGGSAPKKISKAFSLTDSTQLCSNIGASIRTMNLAQRF
jgi:hypothetical protein